MDDLAALARADGWTEERHAAFLERMELSFVQQVLGGGGDVRQASRGLGRRPAPKAEGGRGRLVPVPVQDALPLDRPLPDSAVESNRPARRREADDARRRPLDPAAGF